MEILKRIKEELELEIKRKKKINTIGVLEALDELQNKIDNINAIITNITNNNYDITMKNIDISLTAIEPNSELLSKIGTIKELVDLKSRQQSKVIQCAIENAEKQIKNDNIVQELQEVVNKISIEINKLVNKKNNNNKEIIRMQRISLSVKEDKILPLIEEDTFELLKYIKESELPLEEKKELYITIWYECTKNIEKNIKKNNNILKNEVIKNKELVNEQLEKELIKKGLYHTENIEENLEISEELILTLKEQKIIDAINDIVTKNNKKISNSDKKIFDSIVDDYTLEKRKDIYGLKYFDLICYDLKHNLIPNINNENKNSILEIYNYIIELNELKNKQITKEFYISKINKLSDDELAEIKLAEDLYLPELNKVSEEIKQRIQENKNNIDPNQKIEDLILAIGEENKDNLKFLYYTLLKLFEEKLKEYRTISNDEYNYYLNVYDKNSSNLAKDIDILISTIKKLLKKIKEVRNKINNNLR